jgi:predicted GNAT family N-acyltransferase
MVIEIAPYSSDFYQKSLQLRDQELRKPLGLDLTSVDTSDDIDHVHFVAVEDEEVVGIVVLVPNYHPKVGKLRQMATAEKVRGQRIGVALVQKLEEYAHENRMNKIELHARDYAKGFYSKLGYKITSDVFYEVEIPHYKMEKNLG